VAGAAGDQVNGILGPSVGTAACHLLIIETNGNQAYIFGTRRQRENVGASYLTKQLPVWVASACAKNGAVPLLLTSGKAIAVARRREEAEAVITATALRALDQAPGLDVSGAVMAVEPASLADDIASVQAVRDLHRALGVYNYHRPAPAARFAQLPFVRVCPTSGLPADAEPDPSRLDDQLVSRVSLAKRRAAAEGRRELIQLLAGGGFDATETGVYFPDLAKLDAALNGDPAQPAAAAADSGVLGVTDELARVGIIHVDGNGIGRLFTEVDRYLGDYRAPESAVAEVQSVLGTTPPRSWLFMGQISRALDRATRTAYVVAARQVSSAYQREAGGRDVQAGIVPIVPILLGADDTTVLVAGRYAMIFAVAFLEGFETATADDPLLSPIGLTAAAGVALVRRTFPFHLGYQLAEALCGSAKAASRLRSLVDFHIHRGGADVDLASLDPSAGRRLGPCDPAAWRAAVKQAARSASAGPAYRELREILPTSYLSAADTP
jgi:hypothetical protein